MLSAEWHTGGSRAECEKMGNRDRRDMVWRNRDSFGRGSSFMLDEIRMPRSGLWHLRSKKDPRWDRTGQYTSFVGEPPLLVPMEAQEACLELQAELGESPPNDLRQITLPYPSPKLKRLFQSHVFAAADKQTLFQSLTREQERGTVGGKPEPGGGRFKTRQAGSNGVSSPDGAIHWNPRREPANLAVGLGLPGVQRPGPSDAEIRSNRQGLRSSA